MINPDNSSSYPQEGEKWQNSAGHVFTVVQCSMGYVQYEDDQGALHVDRTQTWVNLGVRRVPRPAGT